MSLLSYNIRGNANSAKLSSIKNLILLENIYIFMLQNMKVHENEDLIVKLLYDGVEIQWITKKAIGRSE